MKRSMADQMSMAALDAAWATTAARQPDRPPGRIKIRKGPKNHGTGKRKLQQARAGAARQQAKQAAAVAALTHRPRRPIETIDTCQWVELRAPNPQRKRGWDYRLGCQSTSSDPGWVLAIGNRPWTPTEWRRLKP